MLGNNTMETASTEVTSIRCRNYVEKSTWRTHWYFVDFESRIHVEISTSNRCHDFLVDSPFKLDEILTNFPCGISTSNRWRIDENVPIGKGQNQPPEVLYEKSYRKTPLLELLFKKVACLKDWNFIKNRGQRKCFPVNIE